jgi:AmmeMemoRadiSam system protein B
MPTPLPRLRLNLDFMPSPVEDRPGLLVRDGLQYSPATLIIPPVLVHGLEYFDGERSEADLKEHLYRLTGELDSASVVAHLKETLSQAGFLEDEVFAAMRDEAHEAFAASPAVVASHAGAAYPDEPGEAKELFAEYLTREAGNRTFVPRRLLGIAAPHVSPFGGWESYQAAYRLLGPEHRDKIFVVLGTSHSGDPAKFGLTRKPYLTPFGQSRTAEGLVDELELAAPGAVQMEDYCYSFEHSIEFQVAFLQHVVAPDVQVLPVLCGSFGRSIHFGGRPEQDEDVRRFIDALGGMQAREGDRLCWVLGIDMAHMGRRYGDPFAATAERGEMREVAARDQKRIGAMESGDAAGFWERVQERRDDLKWCGSGPVYTFLKAVPEARGHLLRYQQWNIDEHSVVSFAGLAFERGSLIL